MAAGQKRQECGMKSKQFKGEINRRKTPWIARLKSTKHACVAWGKAGSLSDPAFYKYDSR
jgi:hypothetical protein